MKLRSLNHSCYKHEYHIVWGTKFRRKYIKQYVKDALIHSLYETVKQYPTLYITTVNTDQDHIHLQVEVPPDMMVSTAVRLFKARSSVDLKRRFKFIKRMYPDGNIWSVGYYSSTIGLNEAEIRRYIEYQGIRDTPQELPLSLFDSVAS